MTGCYTATDTTAFVTKIIATVIAMAADIVAVKTRVVVANVTDIVAVKTWVVVAMATDIVAVKTRVFFVNVSDIVAKATDIAMHNNDVKTDELYWD